MARTRKRDYSSILQCGLGALPLGNARPVFVAIDQGYGGFDGRIPVTGFGPGSPLLKHSASDALIVRSTRDRIELGEKIRREFSRVRVTAPHDFSQNETIFEGSANWAKDRNLQAADDEVR